LRNPRRVVFSESSAFLRQLISLERAAAASPSPTTLGVTAMTPEGGKWMDGFMSAPELE
jgi:hypothetical protein